MKKYLAFILALAIALTMLIIPDITAIAQTESVQLEASSMQKLMDLGIFTKTDADKMNLEQTISREEFAVILVQVNGQQDNLALYRNSSSFSDVPATRWSSPYIQCAVKLGYMTEMPDGKFHPTDKISFSLVAAVFGKLLGYNNANLPGSYPYNYLTQLGNLGILDDISWTASGPVTRGQMAVMVLRLFSAKVFGADKAFVETLSNYKWAIILENGVTNKEGDERRIVTDKGTFYLKEGLTVPQAGKRYILRIKDNEVQYAGPDSLDYKELSVLSFGSGMVTTNEGEKVVVPAGIPCYYKGTETNYDAISGSIQANSSVIIGYDDNKAAYMALFDPLYSDPEVIDSKTAGTPLEVRFGSLTIEKNGKYITASQIEVNDVVYKVTDLWGRYPYIIVYENKVQGKITAILPNKVSPAAIEVDGTRYTLAGSFQKEKLTKSGVLEAGETATIILGTDGNVVDIIADTVGGTDAYCLVLNAWTENSVKSEDYGTPRYYVTLLHSNGGKKTYQAEKSMINLRGKVATYEVIAKDYDDYDTVRLKGIDNNASGNYRVNKDDRLINDIYVASGAVLFNIVNRSTPEIQASVISFGDLPGGYLMDGKVKYIHRSGDFMDIDVMLLDDVLEENTAYGLVTGKKATGGMAGDEFVISESLTIVVNGQAMTYTASNSGVYVGSIVKVRLNGNGIAEILYSKTADAVGYNIEAVDSTRIKINGKVYFYGRQLSIYKLSGQSNWKVLKPSDLSKNMDFGSITIYLDKPVSFGGKVAAIIIR